MPTITKDACVESVGIGTLEIGYLRGSGWTCQLQGGKIRCCTFDNPRFVPHVLVPPDAGEGRAIRAEEALPRGDSFGSFSLSSPTNASQNRAWRRAFGFRVAFDHPTVETAGNMGGCYLVGVTTSSFTGYADQNGLQQSPFFGASKMVARNMKGLDTTHPEPTAGPRL